MKELKIELVDQRTFLLPSATAASWALAALKAAGYDGFANKTDNGVWVITAFRERRWKLCA